ncbi:FHA domain-containing protein [Actinophytocola sediminis]
MPTCPSGHDSADTEFCDVCGRAMDGPAPAPAAGSHSAAPSPPPEPDAPATGTPCASCGAPLTGRFCEQCGHDSLAAPPAAASPTVPTGESNAPDMSGALDSRGGSVGLAAAAGPGWAVTVSADRDYYASVMAVEGPDAGGIGFPPFCPDRNFPLAGKQVSIGRQSRRRGIDPDIDLTGPPEDPGVSHLHALLVAQDDGSWAIVDLDSANGLTVNDETRPLPANTPRALVDGDRVYLGAWTRVTLRAT